MTGFDYGFWEIAIEKYGRLKLPTDLLKSLPETERKSFLVTHGFGQNVLLWTETAYRAQMAFLNSLDMNIIENKIYRNAFLRDTVLIESDSQDRIVVPKAFMEYYKIEKEVVLLLANDKIELWDATEFNAQFDMSPKAFELLNQKIHAPNYSNQPNQPIEKN
jgi:division/cell wall cluster transcriptional repressor MraZ